MQIIPLMKSFVVTYNNNEYILSQFLPSNPKNDTTYSIYPPVDAELHFQFTKHLEAIQNEQTRLIEVGKLTEKDE